MAQTYRLEDGKYLCRIQVIPPDTFILMDLHDIHVYPPLQFKNKKQEEFYRKLVRDVKRTLPYAKLAGRTIEETNKKLATISNQRERKKYLKAFEKELFASYEKELKKLTLSQGKLLIRLIDRECSVTSYDLIKEFRGGFSAFFWQGFAGVFGANLKSEYDASDKDKLIERVINLVEAGQL